MTATCPCSATHSPNTAIATHPTLLEPLLRSNTPAQRHGARPASANVFSGSPSVVLLNEAFSLGVRRALPPLTERGLESPPKRSETSTAARPQLRSVTRRLNSAA